jgi:peptidyl-prolyl cis-trans isomerase B (cyclophilin B)
VIFLYPNGDNYAIIFSSPSSAYSKDVKVFDSIIDTFYAGNVKQIKTTNIQNESSSEGGGCLIATATYGTELAPQVQLLRELRDNSLLQTKSGTSFMASFNQFYYSFSPTISDWERQSPLFKEIVKTTITPMLSTMSILNYANIDSEQQMLGYGIGVILMNIGMYFVAPAVVIHTIKKKI